MDAIFVQITTGCNAKCVTCPHSITYGTKPVEKMSDIVWEKIVHDVKEMGYSKQVGLYLHHEPLIESSLFDKIEQINNETEAFVVLSTNGLLLNKQVQEKLNKIGIGKLHINMSSANKDQYELIMKIPFDVVVKNVKEILKSAEFPIEINCPVINGIDTNFEKLFPGVVANTEYYANSRIGLLDNVSCKGKNTRFTSTYCFQPQQNFNILHDGSVILCCNDWAQSSKGFFKNVLDSSISEIYQETLLIGNKFKEGIYPEMCLPCVKEMGYVTK